MTREEEIKSFMNKYGYSSLIGREHIEYLLARNEELQRRVERMELNAMRIDVVLDAAKGVIEDGDYDVHFENRSAALIDSGLVLRLENAVKALDAKDHGDD